MAGIQIKNVKLSKNGIEYLHNINLNIDYGTNVVIKPVGDKDFKSAQYLVRVISSTVKPTSGSVDFGTFNDNRILFGYKNFEGIFKKGVVVNDLVKTLIKTQKLTETNKTEIKEIGEMLKIDTFVQKKTNELSSDQLNILNLYTLLIVKPHAILLDSLVLPGSEKMHSAILNFIHDYCKSYRVSLIVVSNSKNVVEEIADRTISISDTRVVADSKIKKISESEQLNVDNKTKAFDLEDDILAVLNEKTPTNHLSLDEEETPVRKPQPTKKMEPKIQSRATNKYEPVSSSNYDSTEKDLVKTITKALDLDFEDLEDFSIIETNDDETKVTNLLEDEDELQKSLTEELLTIKYEAELDNSTDDVEEELTIVTESFAPRHKTSLNSRMTGSLDYVDDEIHNKTKKLNEDSKDILQDINMSFGNSQEQPKTKTLRLSDEEDNSDKSTLLTNSFLADLKETYVIRRQLSEKIKSPDFNQLTPELQLKVYENFECADKLIQETDPNGDYDPYRIKTREVSAATSSTIPTMPINQRNSTVTQKLIEEISLDEEDDDEDITESMATSQFETEELEESSNNTLNKVIDDLAMSDAFEEDFEEDKVPQASAYQYLDNEKKSKAHWKDRFAKKEADKSISEKMYGPTKELDDEDEDDTTDLLDDDTTNLFNDTTDSLNHEEEIITSKLETDDIDAFTKDLNDHFEPTSKLASAIAGNTTRNTRSFFDETEELDNKTRRTTNVVLPTREFKTQGLTEEQTRRLKTMAIKQRSKKNLIEKLYDEALDDFKIIDDIKGKKGK